MKRSALILAAFFVVTEIASAQIVESSYAVGVRRRIVTDVNYSVGCNFKSLDGNDSVTICDLFPSQELYADANGTPELSDRLVTTCNNWMTRYGYCDFGNPGDPQWYEYGVWTPANVSFVRGTGLHFYRSENSPATTLTVMGRVPEDATYAHANLMGFTTVSSAYPQWTSFNDFGIDAYASDDIYYRDGVVFEKTVTYYNLENPGDPQWYDDEYVASTSGVDIVEAFFYIHYSYTPVTWTETKPY